MKGQVVQAELDSDDGSTMAEKVKVLLHIKLSTNLRATHKNHESKEENIIWKCGFCKKYCRSVEALAVHVKRVHKEELKNEKTRESNKRKCGICGNIYSNKGNVLRHIRTAHLIEKVKCGKKYTIKENLNRYVKTAHSVHPRKAVAAVTKKRVLTKGKENISKPKGKVHSVATPKEVAAVTEKAVQIKDKHKGKAHSGAPLKEVAALREKTGVIKGTSHSTETPKLPVTKFTKYKCRCGKTENTYDASVRHAQEHLVELEVDRHNTGDNSYRPLIQTEFDYKLLLTDSWFNAFERTQLFSTILTSSLYKYTRCVKLNWDSEKKEEGGGHCVPLYKCGACNLFVEPAKVENHCESGRACVTLKPQKYECLKCQKYFTTSNALKLHNKDHDTYENLRFRIVTFNNEDDVEFNKALFSLKNTQAKEQENISRSPETPERKVLEKNDDVQNTSHNNAAISVWKYCNPCQRSYSDLEDHNAYHENKSKRITETITSEAEAAETAAKKQNGNTKKVAEPEENVSNNDNTRRDSDIRRGHVQAEQHYANRMAIDSESAVMEWNSDSDSEDDDHQSFNTFSSQAQLNLIAKHFERIVTKDDEIKQKPYNDSRKLQGNRKNDNDAVKGVIGEHDQFDQCELTLVRIFGEDNNGVDTLESDNESQSTEDLQRVLEGDAESVLSDDEQEEDEDVD